MILIQSWERTQKWDWKLRDVATLATLMSQHLPYNIKVPDVGKYCLIPSTGEVKSVHVAAFKGV